VDETADEKSSGTAAGAARQYSGTVGGIALCQVAVTLTYATGRGHALIGRALYLPEACLAAAGLSVRSAWTCRPVRCRRQR
jgi:SRSO17 transposase